MTLRTLSKIATTLSACAICVGLTACAKAHAPATKESAQPAQSAQPTAAERARLNAAATAERAREMKLLGIKALQPPETAYDIGKPGNVNYDEAKANPYPKLPDVLRMNDGTMVKTAAQWKVRRAQIVAIFDEDVYGKVPADVPKVTWKVDSVQNMTVDGVPAIVKHVTGHVDNSAYPAITVNIEADVVTPASAKGRKVPVIIGGGSLHPFHFHPQPRPGQPVHMIAMPPNPPNSAQLLLQKGWGFVDRNLTDVQADNGGELDKGIIGLTNKGQPRKLDDWGVIRAWAWTDSRIMDYLETDPDVDATKVGVMGHSRYGQAALVALAYDPRFAIGYISSSGRGGAALYRRNYGEAMGNLSALSEFDWYAANFMRYCAVGHSANEMPVDSHEFIALVTPRAIFVSGGTLYTDPKYVPGDAWQDAKGMFMAAAAASPVWNLLGAKGLGTTTFPPMGTLIDSGDVAFRQHRYGHTPAPNWPYFIQFAQQEFQRGR